MIICFRREAEISTIRRNATATMLLMRLEELRKDIESIEQEIVQKNKTDEVDNELENQWEHATKSSSSTNSTKSSVNEFSIDSPFKDFPFSEYILKISKRKLDEMIAYNKKSQYRL